MDLHSVQQPGGWFTRHEAGACGRADWLDVVMFEDDASLGKSIDARSQHRLVVVANVGVALVVRHDEEYVWLTRRLAGRRQPAAHKQRRRNGAANPRHTLHVKCTAVCKPLVI